MVFLMFLVAEVVSVYHELNCHTVYSAEQVIDNKMEIRLPLAQVFE